MDLQEEIRQKKGREKIVMLTAYDFQTARMLDEMKIDLILVGDSLGTVFQGHKDTKSVTMEDMVYHASVVARGAVNTPIIVDMPIDSYNTIESALENAQRLLSTGARGVKIEGSWPQIVKALIAAKIPVMGHVGMLPQTAESYKVKGKTTEEKEKIVHEALELEACGVFSIVIECVPESLAKKITELLKVPTIGIGAGKFCDGQVLVINDLLGMNDSYTPKFVKPYANLNSVVKNAVARYREEVLTGNYPDDEHTYH